nr:uncharacterized protein LOC125423972 [Ziziphus jujuba var. spinosa]
MFSSEQIGSGPPKFDGSNYHLWAFKMQAYLEALNLWEAVKQDTDPPPLSYTPTLIQIKRQEELIQRKPKALTCIHQAVTNAVFTKIINIKSPKEVWNKLKLEFEGNNKVKSVNLRTLKREFDLIKMKEGENIKEYALRLLDVANKIRFLGQDFPDENIIEKLFISLPTNCESKISAIEESVDTKTLDISELISRLYAFEKRLNIRDDEEDNVEGAFQARHKSKHSKRDGKKPANSNQKPSFPPFKHCTRTNHKEEDCKYKGKPPIQRRFCKKVGHFERNCRLKNAQGKGGTTQQANVIEEEEEEEPEANRMHKSMAKEESLFQSLDKSVKLKIIIGNGQVLEAIGRGTVLVQTKAGPRLINQVLYVPSLSHNLLSVPQMLLNGYFILFKRNSCYIYDKKGSLTARLPMVNKSFMLNLNIQKEEACNVKVDESKM